MSVQLSCTFCQRSFSDLRLQVFQKRALNYFAEDFEFIWREKLAAWIIWNYNLAMKKVCRIIFCYMCATVGKLPFTMIWYLQLEYGQINVLMLAAEHEDRAELEPFVMFDDEPQLEKGACAMIDDSDAHALDQILAVEGDDLKMDAASSFERDEMGTKLAFDHESCDRDTDHIRQPVARVRAPCLRIYKPIYSILQHQTSPMWTGQV